jgi:glycosyltransferase 2 family protein
MVKIWPLLRRNISWVGRVLAVVGIVFVVLRLRNYAGQIDIASITKMTWVLLAGFAVFFSMTNLLLALAWWKLLDKFGAITSCRWVLRTYGVSQIAKYIPGTIFQFVGRQTIGTAAGVAGWALAKSAVAEVVIISCTGALFGLLLLPLVWTGMTVLQSVAAFAIVLVLAAIGLSHFFGSQVTCTLGFYFVYHVVSGAMFIGLLKTVSFQSEAPQLPLILSLGAYVIAWLAGFLTPGAPAGLGIREAVLLFLLGARVIEADLLLVIVLHRAVTVVGDVIFFAWASLIKPEVRTNESS